VEEMTLEQLYGDDPTLASEVALKRNTYRSVSHRCGHTRVGCSNTVSQVVAKCAVTLSPLCGWRGAQR